MASERQIAANRRNAARSTGPRTAEGKARSRRNAVQHGLTAETVIPSLEEAAAYQSLQQQLIEDFCPTTAIERELVARLASLFWRLRRATRIETGLFEQCTPRAPENPTAFIKNPSMTVFYDILRAAHRSPKSAQTPQINKPPPPPSRTPKTATECQTEETTTAYLLLHDQSAPAFKRLNRYEVAIWRQVGQTMLLAFDFAL